MLLTAAEMAHTIVSFSSVLYMSKIDSRLEALHQAGMIYFQLRNVPGGNEYDYDFGYFFNQNVHLYQKNRSVECS